MTNEAKQINIVERHSNRNNSNLRHVCIPSKCATYFPLQSCGSICGASASTCGALAAFRYDLFEKLCKCTGKDTTSTLKKIGYLKNVSLYGPILRVVIMKWCLNGIIDIGDIVGPENEVPVKATSKILLNKHNTEDSFTANSKQSEKRNSPQKKRNFNRNGDEVVLDKFLVCEKKQKKQTKKSTCFPEIIKTPNEPLAVNATPDLEIEKKASGKNDSNNIHFTEWEKIKNIDDQ